MNLVWAIAIAGLGFAAGTGLYDSATGRNRKILRHTLTAAAWLVSLWVFSRVGS